MFVLRPHNYVSLLNASPSEPASLFVNFLREQPGGEGLGLKFPDGGGRDAFFSVISCYFLYFCELQREKQNKPVLRASA
jgi:hypothetical protein